MQLHVLSLTFLEKQKLKSRNDRCASHLTKYEFRLLFHIFCLQNAGMHAFCVNEKEVIMILIISLLLLHHAFE